MLHCTLYVCVSRCVRETWEGEAGREGGRGGGNSMVVEETTGKRFSGFIYGPHDMGGSLPQSGQGRGEIWRPLN